MHKTYRVACEDHDEYGDVPDYDAAVDFETAHTQTYPGHRVDSEPYPFPPVVKIHDPRSGEF
jgi:hypothetical protein